MVGGKKTVSTNVFGMKWKQWPICEMGMSQQCVALLGKSMGWGNPDGLPVIYNQIV